MGYYGHTRKQRRWFWVLVLIVCAYVAFLFVAGMLEQINKTEASQEEFDNVINRVQNKFDEAVRNEN